VQVVDLPVESARAWLTDLLSHHHEYEIAAGARSRDGRIGVLLIQKPEALRLTGGTYFISASMLQPVMYRIFGPVGSWNPRYEQTYQVLLAEAAPLLSDDSSARAAAVPRRRPTDWWRTMTYYDMYRFGRLTAYLRSLEPSDTINGSILVYHLTDADVARALDGPPPELGPDVPAAAGWAGSLP
jgi:hypothetical protein